MSLKDELLITHYSPDSPFVEAYRALRTNILFSTETYKALGASVIYFSGKTPSWSFLITSAGPQEGKSTVAVNLAITMAQAGNKTILTDADLRRPTLHRLFKVSNEIGLSTLLSEGRAVSKSIKQTLVETVIPNLAFLPAGPPPPSPSELLGAPRMRDLLNELKNQAEIILLDTPPVVVFSDALAVSTLVEGVILVVSIGEIARRIEEQAKTQLESIKGRIVGMVLNKVKVHEDARYYHYCRYYSKKKKVASG